MNGCLPGLLSRLLSEDLEIAIACLARALAAPLAHSIASGALPFEPGQPQIGIVMTYVPQARKIREALQQQGLDNHAGGGTILHFRATKKNDMGSRFPRNFAPAQSLTLNKRLQVSMC
jgi:hypothetical protein